MEARDVAAFEAGRTDPPAALLDRLPYAEVDYLLGAEQNPALDERLTRALLRNRRAPQALLRRLATHPRFARAYEIRAAIARHPATPRALGLNLIPHLYWRDLASVADDPQAPPAIRRAAGRTLEDRLEGLALGEQTALARTGGRAVVLALRHRVPAQAADALLTNPHLVEDDVLAVASHRDTPPEVLAVVGRKRRWYCRYAVRLALVRNPHTPPGVVLGLLTGLRRRDLENLASRDDLALVVRLAAERVLRERHGTGPPDAAPEAG